MDGGSAFALGVFVVAVALTALSGARFTPGEWFERLNHPSWRPPNWIFPLVWTPLYALIAWAGWRVWEVTGWSGDRMLGVADLPPVAGGLVDAEDGGGAGRPLRTSPWPYLLILVLLSAEWVLRRRRGLR